MGQIMAIALKAAIINLLSERVGEWGFSVDSKN
jgi:hypothetical protein